MRVNYSSIVAYKKEMSYFVTWLQTNNITKDVFKLAKKIVRYNDFSLEDLRTIKCIKTDKKNTRLNLVLPTANKYKVFGGIATALKIFDMLAEEMSADVRIIIIGKEGFNRKYSLCREGYNYNSTEGQKQFVFLEDTDDELVVGENDIFMCTSWDTAYCIAPVIKWKKKIFPERNHKLIYLIQDFEPGFYSWSTEYLLADSTYRNVDIDTIAIFNSKELYDSFSLKHYEFYKKYYFMPTLNDSLAELLPKEYGERKKIILLYGRPGTRRNAFSLMLHALKLWATTFEDADQWSVIALGETFEDISLPNNVKVVCKGKVSLEEYAKFMSKSYIGISLMVSPHPSYPPLEMSTFGVKTITNTFENKDLSEFNSNIISLKRCTPETICDKLTELCKLYPQKLGEINSETEYVRGSERLLDILREVSKEILQDRNGYEKNN